MAWTSADSPLLVAWLPGAALRVAGAIGLTLAPGKKDLPRWARDLAIDLATLRHTHGTTLLVSLIEDHEYRMLQIPGLPRAALALGMRHLRLPIPDLGAPTDDAAAARLVDDILDEARGAGRVVIHCRGGLGRAGTVAGACLLALGHDAADAMRIVRGARVGAIETREQEQWIARRAASPPAPSARERSVRRFLDVACAAPAHAPLLLAVTEGIIRALQRQRDRGQAAPLAVIRAALERAGIPAPVDGSAAAACAAPLAIAAATPALARDVAALLGLEADAVAGAAAALREGATPPLPPAWRDLALAEAVQRAARDLHAIAVDGRVLSYADYPPS